MEENKEKETEKADIENNKNSENTNIQQEEMKTVKEFEELNDRFKRIFAEFENYKKRSQKERETLYNSLLGDIISGMLPIMDNLENALKAECKDENYKQGIELVQKQFKEFLNKHNVEEIPTIGEMFDPGLHEAVSSVQEEGKRQGEIVQEFRKGYKIGNKVLRHSMVVVSN